MVPSSFWFAKKSFISRKFWCVCFDWSWSLFGTILYINVSCSRYLWKGTFSNVLRGVVSKTFTGGSPRTPIFDLHLLAVQAPHLLLRSIPDIITLLPIPKFNSGQTLIKPLGLYSHSAYSHTSVIVTDFSLPKQQNTLFTVTFKGKMLNSHKTSSLENNFLACVTQFCVHFSLMQIKVDQDNVFIWCSRHFLQTDQFVYFLTNKR